MQTLYTKIYADFVEAFDGIDNGINAFPDHKGTPLYRSRTDISSRVGHLNPRWNEESSDKLLDERFEQASQLAGKEFLERVDYTANAWLPARDIVLAAVEKRKEVHPSGKVLVFDSFSPWKVSNRFSYWLWRRRRPRASHDEHARTKIYWTRRLMMTRPSGRG